MSIQRVEGGLEQRRERIRVGVSGFRAPRARHFASDVLPQIAVARRVFAGDVVVHRHAGEFDDAAFDGVHERKVAYCPRKQRPLGVSRPAQEEGSGGQVNRLRKSDFAADCF